MSPMSEVAGVCKVQALEDVHVTEFYPQAEYAQRANTALHAMSCRILLSLPSTGHPIL